MRAEVIGPGQSVTETGPGEWVVTYSSQSKQTPDDAKQAVARAFGQNSKTDVWKDNGLLVATALTPAVSAANTRVFHVKTRELG